MSTAATVDGESLPIFLDQVVCHGDENQLKDCGTFRGTVGLHSCNHSQLVAVKCNGMRDTFQQPLHFILLLIVVLRRCLSQDIF